MCDSHLYAARTSIKPEWEKKFRDNIAYKNLMLRVFFLQPAFLLLCYTIRLAFTTAGEMFYMLNLSL